jgi:hypothetical protein
MTKTVSALYDTYADATAAVRALEAAGIPHSDISMVANRSTADWNDRTTAPSDAAKDAGAGAGIGAGLGGVGGLLAGLGVMAIPGVGPVVAAGWLVATAVGAAAGAAVGGAAGGLIGSLTEAGVPDEEANLYAEGVRRGGTLVTARVDDAQAGEAQSVLNRQKSVDLTTRGRYYRDNGWTRFDPNATVYTPDQVEKERALYR